MNWKKLMELLAKKMPIFFRVHESCLKLSVELQAINWGRNYGIEIK